MKTRITDKLQEVEAQYDVEILFAVESGSRAWGFASSDSDYDIRFVYKKPIEQYLHLGETKDTINFMTEDNLDGSGWDLKKAMALLAKSNASLHGWIFSSIVYTSNQQTLENMRRLALENFNPVAGFHHYHSMCKRFAYERAEGALSLKALFYELRTALCANWIRKKGTIPPVQFRDLYDLVDAHIAENLDDLMAEKLKSNEQDVLENLYESQPELVQFLDEIRMNNEDNKEGLKSRKVNLDEFNSYLTQELMLQPTY